MHHIRAKISLGIVTFLLIFVIPANGQQNLKPRTPAPRDAKVFFVNIKDGAILPPKTRIEFGVANIEIAPAGEVKSNSGHHHLLIDTGLPPLDAPIPSDFNHLHFGKGQTEVELELAPGEHTLQLLLGDQKHIPHDPPVMSEVVHVRVEAVSVEATRTPSPADARVFFVDLNDGATLPSRATIKFGISGMRIAPAGTKTANSGHFHLLIDTPLPALDREIPSDLNHLHFGRGQTDTELTLTPGEHTLQLLLGDYEHIPHDPAVFSAPIHVHVVETGTSAVPGVPAGRQPSPPDAAVYFIYPHNGDKIYRSSIIRFGLRNMGVAPAGVRRPNTGHHHLVIDAETPRLDAPIPNDLNHIHLGGGQTEKRITLPPGQHTLQLIFADAQHVPHDPPVISERIRVTVRSGVRGHHHRGGRRS
jgi:hypothetical protein